MPWVRSLSATSSPGFIALTEQCERIAVEQAREEPAVHRAPWLNEKTPIPSKVRPGTRPAPGHTSRFFSFTMPLHVLHHLIHARQAQIMPTVMLIGCMACKAAMAGGRRPCLPALPFNAFLSRN